MFPLWVDKGGFSVDVVFLEREGINDFAGMQGSTIIVSGELTRASGKSHDTLRLMANKIIRMEE